jgi:CubicO group peptidase (beta-lactamase class C family)
VGNTLAQIPITKTVRVVILLVFSQFAVLSWGADDSAVSPIVPAEGYRWPQKTRDYWPNTGWISSTMDDNGIDPDRMAEVDRLAQGDPLIRALLVVRDGYLVYENYFHGGSAGQSTEVWSVTKSLVSALIGIAIDKGHIGSIDDLMVNYLPAYPEFRDLTIRHVLTHTTGLEWTEEGDDFVGWIESDDWVSNAIRRQRLHNPGETLLYSSGNSHFLAALLATSTGMPVGEYANENIFNPLGIDFRRQDPDSRAREWEDFLVRTPGTWKLDSQGIEVGAFGLSLTAREMAKFGYLFLNKGRWQDEDLIAEDWVEESTRDHVLRSENFGFGYHWVVSRRGGHLAFNADGWGGQIICVIPDLDMVVVIKSESESPASHPYYDLLEDVIEAAVTSLYSNSLGIDW